MNPIPQSQEREHKTPIGRSPDMADWITANALSVSEGEAYAVMNPLV